MDAIRATGRALIPLTPGMRPGMWTGSTPGGAGGTRPSALFLAQLVATAQDAPQTRRRRRAPVEDATNAYAAAVHRRPSAALLRSI